MTCPRTCKLRDSGECYAQGGMVGMHLRRMAKTGALVTLARRSRNAKICGPQDRVATTYLPVFGDRTPLAYARAEAAAIDAFKRPDGTSLRIHTSGDCRTPKAAETVSAACSRWYARGGSTAWTYTHAWRTVHRGHWGPVSVLGSIDNIGEADRAIGQGYALARYVSEFPSKTWSEGGIRWIACPAQYRNTACSQCRLCWADHTLRESDSGIAFSAHGMRAKALQRRIGAGT